MLLHMHHVTRRMSWWSRQNTLKFVAMQGNWPFAGSAQRNSNSSFMLFFWYLFCCVLHGRVHGGHHRAQRWGSRKTIDSCHLPSFMRITQHCLIHTPRTPGCGWGDHRKVHMGSVFPSVRCARFESHLTPAVLRLPNHTVHVAPREPATRGGGTLFRENLNYLFPSVCYVYF